MSDDRKKRTWHLFWLGLGIALLAVVLFIAFAETQTIGEWYPKAFHESSDHQRRR